MRPDNIAYEKVGLSQTTLLRLRHIGTLQDGLNHLKSFIKMLFIILNIELWSAMPNEAAKSTTIAPTEEEARSVARIFVSYEA